MLKPDSEPFTWQFGVYVAGPMYSSGDLVTNARQGIDAAHEIHSANIPGVKLHCFVPQAYLLAQLVHPRTHTDAQAWDDHYLRTCKFLVRLPGKSSGGDHEVALAEAEGIPVFYGVLYLLQHVREHYGTYDTSKARDKAVAAAYAPLRKEATCTPLRSFDRASWDGEGCKDGVRLVPASLEPPEGFDSAWYKQRTP